MSAIRSSLVSSSLGSTVELFMQDAARWVRPEEVADRAELNGLSILRLLFHHPSLRAMGWFRLASLASACGIPMVPGMLQRRNQRHFGLELVPGSNIGGGLYIAHPSGCTLVVDSMGENVSIMASVTIGRLEQRRWPQIGDRVFIGAGARVLGAIEIGADAVIGANAVVLTDVEPMNTVVGVPGRPLRSFVDGDERR